MRYTFTVTVRGEVIIADNRTTETITGFDILNAASAIRGFLFNTDGVDIADVDFSEITPVNANQ